MKKTILVTIWTTIAVNLLMSLINPFVFGLMFAATIHYYCGKKAVAIAKDYVENNGGMYTAELYKVSISNHWWGTTLLMVVAEETHQSFLKLLLPSFIRKAIPSFRSPFKG